MEKIKFSTAGEFLNAITTTPYYDDRRNRYTATEDGIVYVRSHERGTKTTSLCEVYIAIKNIYLTAEEPIKVGDKVIETTIDGVKQLRIINKASDITSNMTLIPQYAAQHHFWKEIFKDI